MNNTIISYKIRWSQIYNNWEVVETPITNFTEALEVINMIRNKL